MTKPSFFEPDDEAKSWPPSDSYEADDEEDTSKSAVNEGEADLFNVDSFLDEASSAPESLPNKEKENIPEETTSEETTQQVEEDFLVPIQKEEEPIPVIEEFTEEIASSNLNEEPIIETNEYTHADAEILNAHIDDISAEEEKEDIISSSSNLASEHFNIDDLFDDRDSTIDHSSSQEYKQSNLNDNDNPLAYQTGVSSPDEELKPFRTYTTTDYSEPEVIEESEGTLTVANLLKKVNRNVLILALVIIAFTIYYLISTLSSRNYDQHQGRTERTRPPRKEKNIAQELKLGQRIPVWGISSQKGINTLKEAETVRMIFESSGRDNPFAIPDSILVDYRKAADAAIKQLQPNTYKRKAYRATLVGVLTSKDNTVALIDVQEASFEILEGTGKTKILQLATKAMDKAKKNTQEMVIGSYIGPWAVTKIDSARNTYSEAKVYIEYGGQRKILNMGKSEELGIFDDSGNIDSLDNPIENVSLDDLDDE